MSKAAAIVLLFALGGAAAAYELPAATGTHRVEFTAEEADFNEQSRVISLRREAVVRELGADDGLVRTLKADRLQIDMSSRTVVSDGPFIMEEKGSFFYGRSGEMSYADNTGVIREGRFSYANLVFRGREIRVDDGEYSYRGARFTSCDLVPPHYQVKASRLYLKPDSHFLAYNTVFFLGKVPIFYFPVLYRPLGEGTPFITSVYPGYDERSGAYLKTSYLYRFTPTLKGKLFIDYFSKLGFGTGGEVNHDSADSARTHLSAYRIRESGAGEDRWALSGGYWRNLGGTGEGGANYYSQSYFRLLSDPDFNNHYFRSNPFAVSPDMQAGAAFTRQSNNTVTRVSAATRYDRDAAGTGFRQAYDSAPRLDFQTVPLRLAGVPVLNSFSTFLERSKSEGEAYYQNKGGASWTVSKNIPLTRAVTLYPHAGYGQSVFMSTSSATEDLWVGRYSNGLNMRLDGLWGSLDLAYAYRQRFRANTLKEDSAAADGGVEEESITPTLFVRPSRKYYLRASTSYDLRSVAIGNFAHRLSTMKAELAYDPKPGVSFILQDEYSFTDGHRAVIAQADFAVETNSLGLGVAKYADSPEYVVSNTIGVRPGWRGWSGDLTLRYRLTLADRVGVDKFSFFEKSARLYKEFHDFRSTWNLRLRPGGVKEFFFLITMKINDAPRNEPLDEESRRFWTHWREPGQIRD
ncbi:MAG: LPS-assembly protein [Elusimicrobia bacterium]|nr:MAG: LPS-assembly protein [Elusimicrobiota bacterium]KAF0154409.1 MAG: LPS-assembly protein [Elusimicrobiota bacterium]